MKLIKTSVLDEIYKQANDIRSDAEHALEHIGMIKEIAKPDSDMELELKLNYILSTIPVLETYFECIESSAKCIDLTVKLPSATKFPKEKHQ